MAVTWNSQFGTTLTGGDTLSFDVATAPGSHLSGIISIEWRDQLLSTSLGTITSVTVNGVDATFIHVTSGAGGNTEQWAITDVVADDVATVVVTWTGDSGPAIVNAVAFMVVFNDASQINPVGAHNVANGTDTTPTVNVAGTETGSMVIDSMVNNETTTTTATVGALQTSRWNTRVGLAANGRIRGAGSTEPCPSGGTITMSWTLGAIKGWSTVAVEVLQYIEFTITASAGPNGSITPSGSVQVERFDNQSFTFTPDPGYAVADVLVDSVSQGAISNYTFTNVNANHTISVTFVLAPTVPVSGQTSYSLGYTIPDIGALVPPEVEAAIRRGDQRYMRKG